MLNCSVIMGRLSAEPEVKQTPKGTSVITMQVAVQRSYVKKDEERKTDWIDCVVWGKTAEFVSKHFHKGSLIALQGKLQTRTYKDRNGITRKVTELFADSVEFAEDKPESTSAPADNSSAPGRYNTTQEIPDNLYMYEDDLPF